MKTILLLLLLHGAIADPSIVVDLLRPVDPEAQRGETQDDFEAARRLVQHDLQRAEQDPTEDNIASLKRSLRLLGGIGGFEEALLVNVSGVRSLDNYRELLFYADSLRQKTETVVITPNRIFEFQDRLWVIVGVLSGTISG